MPLHTIVVGFLLALSIGLRAYISHAAAQHFWPLTSVAINAFHLLSKELWVAAVLLGVVSLYGRKHSLHAVHRIVLWAFAVGGVTGCYIIWLHLKGFENVLVTLWGERFAMLTALALLMLGVRLVQWFTTHDARMLLCTELMLGVVVLYMTSLLIITTPPLSDGLGTSLAPGVTTSPYNQREYIVTFNDTMEKVVGIATSSEGERELPVTHLYGGTYAIDHSGLQNDWNIRVIGVRSGAYDDVKAFSSSTTELPRTWDTFGWILAFGALGGAVVCLLIGRFMRSPHASTPTPFRWILALGIVGILVGLCLCIPLILHGAYRGVCVADGHIWENTLPMRDSIVLSAQAAYGCNTGANHIVGLELYYGLRMYGKTGHHH